jgi:hypothetical protein
MGLTCNRRGGKVTHLTIIIQQLVGQWVREGLMREGRDRVASNDWGSVDASLVRDTARSRQRELVR